MGIVTVLLISTVIAVAANTNVSSGPGDGVTTCEVYGADGYTATVVEKVIVGTGTHYDVWVELNKKNETGRAIKVVVQIGNSKYDVIESRTLTIQSKSTRGEVSFYSENGKVYYITINNASCN